MRCLAGPRWVHRVQMVGHGTKFGRKKEQAITALLSHRSMEEAARAAGIGVNTLLRWMKEPEFDQAYRKARREAFGQGTARLQQASGAAVSSILKIMVDQHAAASTKLRAACSGLLHPENHGGPARGGVHEAAGRRYGIDARGQGHRDRRYRGPRRRTGTRRGRVEEDA